MKKLMIAAAIVCAAAFAQAATISWDATSGNVYATDGSYVTDGTIAYLIYSATIDQDSLVKGFTSADYATTVAGYAADKTTTVDGQFSVSGITPADPPEGYGLPAESDGAYFVLFNGDEMYVSEEQYFAYDDGDKIFSAYFDEQYGSMDLAYDAAEGFANQGWYVAPEPTTGLLMLFGLAGLALKRKRA